MTVPKPEFGDSLASQNGPSAKVAEGARSSAPKSLQHNLLKMKVCEDLPAAPAPKNGSSRGGRSRRGGGGEGGQGRGGSASRASPATSPAAAAAAMPPPGAFPQGFPYGPYGQMFYYTMPVPPFGARQGVQQGSSSEAAAGGQQPVPHTMLPFAFPYGASALRPPARPPAGWGGIPLGMPRPALPPSSFHPAAPRTVPLPPRKSASETSAPPTPAHDRSARAALSSGGSSTSNSSCGDAAVDEQATQPEGAQQQQEQEQEQQAGADATAPAGSAGEADSAGEGTAQQQAGDEAGGPASPAATEQRGSSRGQGLDRQPCAFFLKTGTCAYGDRCKFEHPYDLAPHVEFNSLGLPLRPSEPNCSYYMKYKTCGFGHTCKFHHPELTDGGEGEQGAAPAVAGAHPAGPFAAMQYMQYGSGPFAMAFAYPGGPLQGQVPPGFMGPGSPGAPLFAAPHGSPPPLPFVPPTPAAAKAAAALPKQLPGGASTPGGLPAERARLPAVAPVSPMPPVPMPLPVPMASPAAASPLAGGPASMSPPRPLMVFGRSKSAAEGSE